jgi:FkbM family methyltransferase
MQHGIRRICLAIFRNTAFEHLARNVGTKIFQPKAADYDDLTSKLIERCCTTQSNCVDVGAYRGTILKQMAATSTKGKVYAFEPVPMNYCYLKKRFPTAIIYDFAVSDTNDFHEFYYATGRPARSSLIQREYPDKNEKIKTFNVRTECLDNIIPLDVPIHFIKIDVEGVELKVLRGAEKIIRKHKPTILFEHGAEPRSNSELCYSLLSNHLGANIRTIRQFLNHSEPLSKSLFLDELYENNECYFVANYDQ